MGLLALASCSDRLPIQPQAELPPPTVGPVSESTLEANRALWAASQLDGYRCRFRWECFCTPDHVRVVDITVRHGTIVSVVDAVTRKPLGPQEAARYRTIDGLFDLVRDAIDYPAVSVLGAFDSDLGYPVAAYIDYEANLADEEIGFRIYALIPH